MKDSRALEDLKTELNKILQAQTDCITEDGHVRTGQRYKYKMLVESAQHLKGSIDWLKALYNRD